MLARAPERERRTRDGARKARGEALRERVADPRVGREREMRAVLLGRAERNERDTWSGGECRGELRPDEPSEPALAADVGVRHGGPAVDERSPGTGVADSSAPPTA